MLHVKSELRIRGEAGRGTGGRAGRGKVGVRSGRHGLRVGRRWRRELRVPNHRVRKAKGRQRGCRAGGEGGGGS